MDLVHLINFIIAWEEGKERENFKENTANTPNVHLVVIVSVGQEALWGSIPPGGNILGKRWL